MTTDRKPEEPRATAPEAARPSYERPRVLRKRSVVDATLQITSTPNPGNPPAPIGGE